MMNHQFPTVKTYSTRWQRSYRLYQEKDKLFDTVQASTTANSVKDVSKSDDQREEQVKMSSNHRGRLDSNTHRSQLSSKDSVKTQTIHKSPRRSTRPVTVPLLTHRTPVRPRTVTPQITPTIPCPRTVGHKRIPDVTGTALVTKPLRRYGVPAPLKPEAKRIKSSVTASSSTDTHDSAPKVLRVETLLKYRPEHAEKAYCKNDSYIHAWLQGVEEATSKPQDVKNPHDHDSSIEVLREAQTEHPALGRKNSATELLKDMRNAFKASHSEKSFEMSNIREQPSLPEQPLSPKAKKSVLDTQSKGEQQKTPSCPLSKKKSRIPCLSKTSKTTKTSSCDDSAYQASTPTVTRTNENSNHTYTYRWTLGSSSSQEVTANQEKASNLQKDSPTICIAKLKPHKKLNSTTRPKAKSLGKVEFSQCISPILDTEKLQKSAESTPDNHRKRSSHNKENVVPRKQRCVSKKTGNLPPKASTVLFASQTISTTIFTPDISSIRLDKARKPQLAKSDIAKKSFDFDAAEKETDDIEQESYVKKELTFGDDNKETHPVLGPVITSTPDSQHKYIRPELMLLADLSSVAPPSATDDDLVPLRTSGFEINSDEIICASDLDFEVDIPEIKDFASPQPLPNNSGQNIAQKQTTTLDSTFTVTPIASTSTSRHKQTVPKSPQLTQPLKESTAIKPRLTVTKKQKSPKLSKYLITGNKSSPSREAQRLNNKGPMKSVAGGKQYSKPSTIQPSSSNSASSDQEKPRWRCFSKVSSNFPVLPLPVLAPRTDGNKGQLIKKPPCSLVAVQRHHRSWKSAVPIRIGAKTTKLMSDLIKAPPDDIMTTARRLLKNQFES